MTGTLINEQNSDLFLSGIPDEALLASDIFFGVIDDDTATACGVLAAESIGDHTLAIRHIYVEEEFRGRGAGTELVYTLMEAAEQMDASSIVCVHSTRNSGDGIAQLLDHCGFVYDDMMVPIYAVSLNEIRLNESDTKTSQIKLKSLNQISDKNWQVYADIWKRNGSTPPGFKGLAFPKSRYSEDLSFVAFDDKNEVTGIILIINTDEMYQLISLSATGENPANTLYELISHSLNKAVLTLGNDARIIVSPTSVSSADLLEHVTDGAYVRIGSTVKYTYDIL